MHSPIDQTQRNQRGDDEITRKQPRRRLLHAGIAFGALALGAGVMLYRADQAAMREAAPAA
uniref:hypothetical protein n=1 Tax=Raoultella planticola TaxID=575 RepID=UPI001952E561